MTTVTTLASRRAAPTPSQATNPGPCPHAGADLIQLHAQACNGLHAALRFLTASHIEADQAAFTQALRRAMRATTALKQACAAMEVAA